MRMTYTGPLPKFAKHGIGARKGEQCDVPAGMVTYFMGNGFAPVLDVPLISSTTLEAPAEQAVASEPTPEPDQEREPLIVIPQLRRRGGPRKHA
jgi:hypothetical protein